jgi:hypothetical protein
MMRGYEVLSNIDQSKKTSWRENFFLKAFLLGLGLSFMVFIPYIIRDGGRFLFYGDFNVQQVAFYRLAHDAIRSGNIGWSHLTDLGANFIGSYSFYLLGSPFFWITIPLPSEWMQYVMGPLLILKFACATLTGYVYLRRYVRDQNFALAGAVMYAFSGFSIFNVFFNHFHEAIIFFPLMLFSLDEYMYNRRRGLFALSVFACCFVNYYFFAGQVIFLLIYFFLRLAMKSWRINLRDFALLFLEAFLGVGTACVLLVPSVLTIIQNNRVNNPINGWNAIVYDKTQRIIHIITCFFFPPDLPARPNFTPDSDSKWASIGAWLPMFGMSGVIGWMQLHRKNWLKKLLYILFFMAAVPGLNAAFQLFNGAYYARWFYMLTLIMSLATVMSLEEERVDWKRSILWTFVITAAIALTIGLMPTITTKDGVKSVSYGLESYPTRLWCYAAISFGSIALLVYIFRFFRNNAEGQRKFSSCVLIGVSFVAMLYSCYFIGLGKTQTTDPYKHLIPYELNAGKDLPMNRDDLDVVRSDFYQSTDNAGMFWEIPTIQCFHSIVPGSIMDFYTFIGVTRNVASRPDTTHYGLRGLTSVKWLFDDSSDEDYFGGSDYSSSKMPGFVFYGNANGYDIWENEYYIPMGFSYDSYVTQTEAESVTQANRELLMLKTLVVADDQADLVSSLLKKYNTSDAIYSNEEYESDCLARQKYTCSDFQYTSSGFTAKITTTTDRVVFFSVPYEDGWSATVNGDNATIIKSNVGFMSVIVPAGENVRITFTYKTPGLSAGITITVISLIAFIGYLILAKRSDRKRLAAIQDHHTKLKARRFSDYAKSTRSSFDKRISKYYLPRKRIPEKLPETSVPSDDSGGGK